jgi:hypothetical protein
MIQRPKSKKQLTHVLFDPDDKAVMLQAAHHARLTLSAWMRTRLRTVALRELNRVPKEEREP